MDHETKILYQIGDYTVNASFADKPTGEYTVNNTSTLVQEHATRLLFDAIKWANICNTNTQSQLTDDPIPEQGELPFGP